MWQKLVDARVFAFLLGRIPRIYMFLQSHYRIINIISCSYYMALLLKVSQCIRTRLCLSVYPHSYNFPLTFLLRGLANYIIARQDHRNITAIVLRATNGNCLPLVIGLSESNCMVTYSWNSCTLSSAKRRILRPSLSLSIENR